MNRRHIFVRNGLHGALVFLILAVVSGCQPRCYSTGGTILDAVNAGEISPDLSMIAFNSPLLVCPKISTGNRELCTCEPVESERWDPGLPDGVLFSIFFLQRQYEVCRPIFQHAAFLKALSRIPDPDQEALRWFELRNISHVCLLPIDDSENVTEMDSVQRKMVTVFYRNRSWTYCPETRLVDAGQIMVHGQYIRESHEIVLFETACAAGSIYGASIKDAVRVLRFFFVSAHEFGHAIDYEAGMLNTDTKEQMRLADQRANLYGALMTQAAARLFRMMLAEWRKAAETHQNVLQRGDLSFVCCEERRWRDMENVFIEMVKKANAGTLRGEWNIVGCVEPVH